MRCLCCFTGILIKKKHYKGDNELNLLWCSNKKIIRNPKTNANLRFTYNEYEFICMYIM